MKRLAGSRMVVLLLACHVICGELQASALDDAFRAEQLLRQLQQIHGSGDHCGAACSSQPLQEALALRLSACLRSRRKVYQERDVRSAGLRPCLMYAGDSIVAPGQAVALLGNVIEPFFILESNRAAVSFLERGRRELIARAAHDAETVAEAVAVAAVFQSAPTAVLDLLGFSALREPLAAVGDAKTPLAQRVDAAVRIVAATEAVMGKQVTSPALDRWHRFRKEGLAIGRCSPQAICAVFRPEAGNPGESTAVSAFAVGPAVELPLGLTIRNTRFVDDANGGHLVFPPSGLVANVREDAGQLRRSLALMGIPPLLADRATFSGLAAGPQALSIAVHLFVAGRTGAVHGELPLQSLIRSANERGLSSAGQAFAERFQARIAEALNSAGFQWTLRGVPLKATFTAKAIGNGRIHLAGRWSAGELGEVEFPVDLVPGVDGALQVMPGDHLVPPAAVEKWIASVRRPLVTALQAAVPPEMRPRHSGMLVIQRAKAVVNALTVDSVTFDEALAVYTAHISVALPAPYGGTLTVTFGPSQPLPDVGARVRDALQRALLAELAASAVASAITAPADLAGRSFEFLGGRIEILSDPPPRFEDGAWSASVRTTFGAVSRTLLRLRIAPSAIGSPAISPADLDFAAVQVTGGTFIDLVADILAARGLALQSAKSLISIRDVRPIRRGLAFRLVLRNLPILPNGIDLGDFELGERTTANIAERIGAPIQNALLGLGEIEQVGPVRNIALDTQRTNLLLASRSRQIVLKAEVIFDAPISGTLKVRITIPESGPLVVEPEQRLETWLAGVLPALVPVLSVDHVLSVKLSRVSETFIAMSPLRFDADIDVTLFDSVPLPTARIVISPSGMDFSQFKPSIDYPAAFIVAPAAPLSLYAVNSTLAVDLTRGALTVSTELTCAATPAEAKLVALAAHIKGSLTVEVREATAKLRGDVKLARSMTIMTVTGTLDIPHAHFEGTQQTGDFLRSIADVGSTVVIDAPTATMSGGTHFKALGLNMQATLTIVLRPPPVIALRGMASILGAEVAVDVSAGVAPPTLSASANLQLPTVLGIDLGGGHLDIKPSFVRLRFHALGANVTVLVPNLSRLDIALLEEIVRSRLQHPELNLSDIIDALRDRNITVSLVESGSGENEDIYTQRTGGSDGGGEESPGLEHGGNPSPTVGPNRGPREATGGGEDKSESSAASRSGGQGDVQTTQANGWFYRVRQNGTAWILVSVFGDHESAPRLLSEETRAHLVSPNVVTLFDTWLFIVTADIEAGTLHAIWFEPPRNSPIEHFPLAEKVDLFEWLDGCRKSKNCDINARLGYLPFLADYEHHIEVRETALLPQDPEQSQPRGFVIAWSGEGSKAECRGIALWPEYPKRDEKNLARSVPFVPTDLQDARCAPPSPGAAFPPLGAAPPDWFRYRPVRIVSAQGNVVESLSGDAARRNRVLRLLSKDLRATEVREYGTRVLAVTDLQPIEPPGRARRGGPEPSQGPPPQGAPPQTVLPLPASLAPPPGFAPAPVRFAKTVSLIGPSAAVQVPVIFAHDAGGGQATGLALPECVARSAPMAAELAGLLDKADEHAVALLLETPQTCSASLITLDPKTSAWMAAGITRLPDDRTKAYRIDGARFTKLFNQWAADGLYHGARPPEGAMWVPTVLRQVLTPGHDWPKTFRANPLGLIGLSAMQ